MSHSVKHLVRAISAFRRPFRVNLQPKHGGEVRSLRHAMYDVSILVCGESRVASYLQRHLPVERVVAVSIAIPERRRRRNDATGQYYSISTSNFCLCQSSSQQGEPDSSLCVRRWWEAREILSDQRRSNVSDGEASGWVLKSLYTGFQH
jgi:hypothetical protein